MLVAALMLATAVGAAGHDAREAAVLEMRGEFAAARAQLRELLAHDPEDGPALFIAACVEIETGNLDAAAARVAQLSAKPGAASHMAVLAALVQRRRGEAREPLRGAVVEAWKKAGRPDLGASPLPGLANLNDALDAIPALTPEQEAALTAGDKLLFMWGTDMSKRLDRAIAAAARPSENTRVVNLEILSELAFQAPFVPERAASAMDAARQVGDALVGRDPDNGYFRLAAWLASAPSNRPLDMHDLDVLEQALAKPRFDFPRPDLLAELRTMARRWDPDHADMRAVSAALAAGNAASVLWKRAEATTADSPAHKALHPRISRVLLGVGKRLEASPTILDRMLAFVLESKGAKLSGDPALDAATQARLDAFRTWYRDVTAAQKRLGTWPFAADWREWTTDEISYFGRLQQPANAPDAP